MWSVLGKSTGTCVCVCEHEWRDCIALKGILVSNPVVGSSSLFEKWSQKREKGNKTDNRRPPSICLLFTILWDNWDFPIGASRVRELEYLSVSFYCWFKAVPKGCWLQSPSSLSEPRQTWPLFWQRPTTLAAGKHWVNRYTQELWILRW